MIASRALRFAVLLAPLAAACTTPLRPADAGPPDAPVAMLDSGPPDSGPPDSGPQDSGPPDAPPPRVTASYPTGDASLCRTPMMCQPLSMRGTTLFFQSGNYVEETLTFGSSSIAALELDIELEDRTQTCAVGASHTFDVLVNGTRVGSYVFVTPSTPAAPRTVPIVQTFPIAPPIAGMGVRNTQYSVRMIATSSVCSGGGAWMWSIGGSATGVAP
jgi:hypothetical protein